MKIKFASNLPHQEEAVNAVVNVFDGQPLAQSKFEISLTRDAGMTPTELGTANNITLTDEQILENVRRIQEENNIEKTGALQGRQFSVEMETGTGKTYVYLRTIFELSRKYGLKKFIIVVPSVAVREGVLKSIEMTREHFNALYDNEPFCSFIYDSRKLGKVRQFAMGNQIQIMIINIQSFQRDISDKEISAMTEDELKRLNVINRENDRMSGRKPIEFVQATNPIVIIDEPQSVDNTDKARNAIDRLNPAVTLRYSATHRTPYNLLYRLDPVKAYDLGLVKRIEVDSVVSEDSFNEAYVRLLKTDNKPAIRAQIEIHRKKNEAVKPARMWVKQGDDLFEKSGRREIYRQGCIVHNIDCTPGAEYIEFTGGRFLRHGEEIGSQTEDVMKIQVRETVEQHLKKELALRGRNIKVLSLFFIDRVANYRRYSRDDSPSPGRIAEWFEDAYRDLTARPLYRDLSPDALGHEISGMHDGYFSRDKKGHLKDSTERGSKDDEDAYNLIMRDKERLLDPKEPLRFIFSHSALREGWDNPNVFQICTLNETASAQKKRQEIGRGLRLCVNADGERVYDENINRLTVIANESYENFAATLQSEFEEDFGIRFGHIEQISFAGITREADGEDVPIGQEESRAIWNNLFVEGYIDADGAIQDKFDPDSLHFEFKIDAQHRDIESEIMDVVRNYIFKNRVADARKKVSVKFNKEVFLTPEFAALWEKIRHRTRYSVKFDTGELIASAVKGIMAMEKIRAPRVSVKRVGIDVLAAGVAAERVLEDKSQEVESGAALPDLLAYLQGETELTRHTLVEILRRSRRLGEFPVNPQQFMARVAREILRALQGLMLKGIQYEKIDRFWEMSRIEADAERDITHYLNRLHRVQNARKCIYDAIEVDSRIEREFARDLDNNEHVRLFVKLPRWFKVDTPIGPYNPDWAFMTECDERLYFVRETKSTTNSDKQRKAEKQKTDCGAKHFKAINVDYDVVTSLSKVDLCKQ